MQIFVTSKCPAESAKRLWLRPARARKMIVESLQILACCLRHWGSSQELLKKGGMPYAAPKSRLGHPIVKWACADRRNASWLAAHCQALHALHCLRSPRSAAFANVSQNLQRLRQEIPDWQHLPESDRNAVVFLNFARCRAKQLDFSDDPDVMAAYDRFLKAQGC